MTLSFPIDDLRKSVPEAATLDGLSGDPLIDALRKVLGKLADGAAITVADGMVTLDFGDVPTANVMEAQRLYLKAATCAGKGEFPKATTLYRRVLELDPSRHDARRELAMVFLETGKPDDAVDTLLDVLKTVRDSSGTFLAFDSPPALDYTESAGRFAGLMPRLKPSVREAAAAKATLLAMGMNIVNRGADPSLN